MVRPTAESDPTVLVLRRRYAAPRDQVFAAWTSADALRQWFGPTEEIEVVIAEVDARPGGSYRLGMQNPGEEVVNTVHGVYHEFVPPERLVFTWTWESPTAFAGAETLVTVELSGVGDETELVLTHEKFPAEEMRDKHHWGWSGCVDKLVAHLKKSD